jgi:outer membrane protein
MRREVYAAVLALVVIFISIPTFAQTSLKIAVVDTDKAFQESIWGKKAVEEFEKETNKWQKRGEELDSEIEVLEEKLAKQRSFLNDENEEKRLESEIESKRIEGQDLIQQGRTKLAEKRKELLEPISEEISNLIKGLAMEEGYDLVLEKQLIVLYLNPELDITNRITVMLDNVYREKMSEKAKESENPKPREGEG